MKYHDYGCPESGCDLIVFDVATGDDDLAVELRGDAPQVPACEVHGKPMIIVYLPKGSRPFAEFDHVHDDGRVERVSSLQHLRRLEGESLERWKRGEGRPMIYRQYSQDSSNRNENVFKSLKQQVDRKNFSTRSRRGVPFVTSVTGPAIPYEED